jgi:hypothetical protein
VRAKPLLSLAFLIIGLAYSPIRAAAQETIDSLPYGTFWNGSVETFDNTGGTTCCASYSATTESSLVSQSLFGKGATYDSEGLPFDDATVILDGTAALQGAINVTGSVFALAPFNFGDGSVSLGWFDTVHVVSSTLAAGTPVNFEERLSLNFTDGPFGLSSRASQQVQVSWTPLDGEPPVQPFSIATDCHYSGCGGGSLSQSVTQESLVNLVVGGNYKVTVTVQVSLSGDPYADIEDGVAAASVNSAFALASLTSDASFTTTSGLGEPPDTDGPAITITSPTHTTYVLNENVQSLYSCTDPDDTVPTCAGPVPSGQNIDTASVGNKTFTVNGTDGRGNSSTQSVNYDVAYTVCPLSDASRFAKSGSTIPIKLQLCDANGTDVSDASVVVHATGVLMLPSNKSEPLQNAGKSNSANNFRFDSTLGPSGGYIFNLKTKGYSSGSYALQFTAGNDPTVHTLLFMVK